MEGELDCTDSAVHIDLGSHRRKVAEVILKAVVEAVALVNMRDCDCLALRRGCLLHHHQTCQTESIADNTLYGV